jgi:hypothetical protein
MRQTLNSFLRTSILIEGLYPVALPKQPINRFKPVLNYFIKAGNCPEIYTVECGAQSKTRSFSLDFRYLIYGIQYNHHQ